MSISDRIVVMKAGVVQQTGKPQEVYDDPVNLFVAKFLGTPPINVFQGKIKTERSVSETLPFLTHPVRRIGTFSWESAPRAFF